MLQTFRQSYRSKCICNKIEETTYAGIEFFSFFEFYFQRKPVFNEEENPSQKVVIVEEELDDIDKDSIVNLEKRGKKLANIEIFKDIFNISYFTYKNVINRRNYINKGY